MNPGDREQLKDRLRALANAPLGLHIDTPEHWSVPGIRQPREFFQHLPVLMESNSALYIEGIAIHPEAATFYLKHQTGDPTPVACGTISPIPDVYHLDFSADVVNGMVELATRRSIRELLTHVSGYHLGRLVFSFHDAFESDLQISGHIAEPIVGTFCRALEVSYSRERTQKHGNPYRDLLHVLENPEKIKTPHVPWWRRIWDDFLSGWRNP